MTDSKTTASELAAKTFPIQGEGCVPPRTVPWFVAEAAYRTYTRKYGTRQSLKRLAECHGFGRDELIDLLMPELRRLENIDNYMSRLVGAAATLAVLSTKCAVVGSREKEGLRRNAKRVISIMQEVNHENTGGPTVNELQARIAELEEQVTDLELDLEEEEMKVAEFEAKESTDD